ncbi:hypothetical protein N9F27_01345 [Crocinitomicaceae bacterium]|nr:hypothetical protein [Crocinitomicaceae bacterium]
MKKLIILSTFTVCFGSSQGLAQYNKENLKIKGSSAEITNTAPADFDMSYSFENLRLYPIIANSGFHAEHKDLGNFVLLKEAMDKKKIIITETGGTNQLNNTIEQSNRNINVSGTVNTLIAKNDSKDTVFIMAGEVVKGGKQDRVVAQDIIILPGDKVDLSAFCVEKNRWSTKDGNNGKFTGTYNVANMDIRKTVTTEKNQSQVWKKVDEQTAKNGASSSTSTYTNLENSEEYQENLKKYMEVFQASFKDDKNVIGVIAVTGDKVMGCDMFATHDLFINSYEGLIHSYIGEAITNGKPVTISNDEVFKYLDKILIEESKQNETIKQNGDVYEWNNKKVHISTY